MRRFLIIAAILIAAIGLGTPFINLDFLRPPIERSLQRGLGRRVEVGTVHFTLFSGPGFTVDDVTIHEDPRAGIEPFAYVETLDARVRLWSLFHRKLEFSSLGLTGASIINVVKTSAGPWNFQFLLGPAPQSTAYAATVTADEALSNVGALPAIRMRGGRVNFKFADTKSLVYFDDADLDVSPSRDGSVEVRFSGAPSRTDRSAQDFGHFFVRGVSTPSPSGPQLAMTVELEPSALEEVAKLFDRGGFGLHGAIGLQAQISGTPSALDVTGEVRLSELHSWNLLGRGGWSAGYKGTLDLHHEKLTLASAAEVAGSPLEVHFHLSDFLSTPHWEIAADLNRAPVAALAALAVRMGAALPDKVSVDGSVSGEVSYGDAQGLAGRLEIQDGSYASPGAPPMHAAAAAVFIDREGISLERSTVQIGENETAEIDAAYAFPIPGKFDLKIATRSLGIGALRSLGVGTAPLFDRVSQGTWRGSMRYHWPPPGDAPSGADPLKRAGIWAGDYELQNTRVAIDGLADPVRIQSASVAVNGERVSASRLRGKAGAVSFTGDYRWEPGAARPHQFHLEIPEADATELQRILAPSLVRRGGFLARTLGFAAPQIPEWLASRRASGALCIDSLIVGGTELHIDQARLVWDGPIVRLTGILGGVDQAEFSGDLSVDLASGDPHYRLEGKLKDFAYKGGKLDLDGSLQAEGAGTRLLLSLQGEGTLRGRAITFAPDAEFRTLAASFQMSSSAIGPRVKLSDLEAVQGPETYTGQGITQPDGRLLLELASRGRLVRYIGALSPAAPQP